MTGVAIAAAVAIVAAVAGAPPHLALVAGLICWLMVRDSADAFDRRNDR